MSWLDNIKRNRRESIEAIQMDSSDNLDADAPNNVHKDENSSYPQQLTGGISQGENGEKNDSGLNEAKISSDQERNNQSPQQVVPQGTGFDRDDESTLPTKVIAIINQKGGVGKSTTSVNLSAALTQMGKKVLLIDLDPQGNATSGLGVEKNELDQCVYDILLNDVPVDEVLKKGVFEGLDLIPATINLAGAEVELVSEMAREQRVKDAVNQLRGRYDYVFIDCPPSLGLLTVNALVGCDQLIIPIQTEFYALEGVTKLIESMNRVKTRLNPTLEIFGILLTMYDGRTTLSRQVATEVHNYFGNKVFQTIIPRTVKLSEAPSYGIPICEYDPMGKGAVSYNELAKEVISRG